MLLARQLVRRLLPSIDLFPHLNISKVTPDSAVFILMHTTPSDHYASVWGSNSHSYLAKIQVFDSHDYRQPYHAYYNGTHYDYHLSYYHPLY